MVEARRSIRKLAQEHGKGDRGLNERDSRRSDEKQWIPSEFQK